MNPKNFEERLLARYPNNTKLVDTQVSDENENSQVLMTEEGVLLSEEKFSGVVYVNESTYEVFSGINHRKVGIFKINSETNWNIETPRQAVNKAHKDFKDKIEEFFREIEPNCPCSFPRIIDYLARGSSETSIIANIIRNQYLEHIKFTFDHQTEVESHFYTCKNCANSRLRQ